MWNEMLISNNPQNKQEENTGNKEEKEICVISKERPVEYTGENKRIMKIYREFKKEEYEEIFEFNKIHNKLVSGNITLLNFSLLNKFSSLGMYSVLARGGTKNAIIGMILSLPLPITLKGVKKEQKEEKEIFGVTSFLTVHEKLRTKGLAMALIRELTLLGHENSIYCSYFTSPKKIGTNSISLTSWYRPLNLPKTVGLGFLYPNWNDIPSFKSNMTKYACRSPKDKNYRVIRLAENSEKTTLAFNFYTENTKNKRFVFSPDLLLFKKWVKNFPTFAVSYSEIINKKNKRETIVGIFCYMGVQSHMATGLEGLLCLPLMFVSLEEHRENVMRMLIHTAHEEQFDVLYGYCVGDLCSSPSLLENTNCIIQTQNSQNIGTYFSIYNHTINIQPEDLYVPIF